MKIICQHFWMAVLFNASSLRLEVNAYFGRSKTTSLKSLMTMIGKDRDLDDANYTKETRR